MSYIKVKFIKGNSPSGREYVYKSEFPVEVGDTVKLPSGKGIVTAADVAEEDISAYKDKVKAIVEVIEEDETESM